MDYLILYLSMSVLFLFSCLFISAADVQRGAMLRYVYRFLGKSLRILTYVSVVVFLVSPWYGDVERSAKWALYIMTGSFTIILVSWVVSKLTKWRFL